MCWNFEKKKVKILVIFKFSLILSLVGFLVSHVIHVVANIDRRLLVMYNIFLAHVTSPTLGLGLLLTKLRVLYQMEYP